MGKKNTSITVSAGGAWKPRLCFWLLTAAVLGLCGRELINVMDRPSLTRYSGFAGAGKFVLFQKGSPRERRAWLFVEPDADADERRMERLRP